MSLLDLPFLCLKKILQYVDVGDLIKNVAITCKYLHTFVHNTSSLWKHIDFSYKEDPIVFEDVEQLTTVFCHARQFHCLDFPMFQCRFSLQTLDNCVNWYLVESVNLVWLDLSSTEISSLFFIQFLQNLETLILCHCKNIPNEEFLYVQNCTKIDYFNARFTNLRDETLVEIMKPPIVHIDVAGIFITLKELHRLLARCHTTLLSIMLGLDVLATNEEFEAIRFEYRDVCFSLCPPRFELHGRLIM